MWMIPLQVPEPRTSGWWPGDLHSLQRHPWRRSSPNPATLEGKPEQRQARAIPQRWRHRHSRRQKDLAGEKFPLLSWWWVQWLSRLPHAHDILGLIPAFVYTFFRKALPELSFFYSLNLSEIVPVPEIVLKSVPVTVLVKLMFFVPMLLSVEDFLPHEYSNF